MRAHHAAWHPRPAACLLAGCREVEFGNRRGRKRADAKRVKPLAAPEGGCLSAGLGERSEQGFSFLDGIFFLRAYAPGTFPTKSGFRHRADPEGGGARSRTHTHAHTPARPRAHTPLLGACWTREEGAHRVVTPASAGARPSAPAISAGRSAGTRTPLPAAQSTAKGDPTPAPPPASDARAQPGLEPTSSRGGGRRAQAGTRICHLKSTNHGVARPCRLPQLTPAGGLMDCCSLEPRPLSL